MLVLGAPAPPLTTSVAPLAGSTYCVAKPAGSVTTAIASASGWMLASTGGGVTALFWGFQHAPAHAATATATDITASDGDLRPTPRSLSPTEPRRPYTPGS